MAGVDAILTHENADFDALAALLGAKKLYPEAAALLPRRLNRNVRDFLTLYGDAFAFAQQVQAPRRKYQSVVLVDAQTVASARGLRPDAQVSIVDHHPLARELAPGMTFWGGETGATTTLLTEALREKNLTLAPLEATLLLLGIYEDTGSLLYATTTPRDIRAAAFLLEQGASLTIVNDFLHHPLTDAQRRLFNQLAESAETHDIAGCTVVIAAARARAYVEEVSTLAHQLREMFDPDVLFVLVHMNDHLQIVARSETPALDVAVVAKALGGGGHAQAAAALIRGGDLRKTQARLLKILRAQIKPTATVREIMSFGVHTLAPTTTIAEAAEMAKRYGHEGFPVVAKDKLVGVLTRREIDRAVHHHLQNAPAKNYMQQAVAVEPTDSIAHVQKVMMESGLGQIPVVVKNKIVGIVTRTDIIKQAVQSPQAARAADIRWRLERALPADVLPLIRDAAATARELHYSLYLVGGFVRDLLLGQANLDLDLVVEGDAMALARQLQKKFGGRVHMHTRFGTAKWMLNKHALDFATARTEFYAHPSALPEVERSSIKQDLQRRDFTINTLAICLDPERFGQLLDPFGGESDLQRGWIRVLHNLSFVEDPTRILRAVRFEQRFGFQTEARTVELIADARDMLERVSPERVRSEVYLILVEDAPEKSLARLAELGVLTRIHPRLECDAWLVEKFRELRANKPRPPRPIEYLALAAYRLTRADADQLVKRLTLPKAEAALLDQIIQLRALKSELDAPDLRPSGIYNLLGEFEDDALALFALATDREQIRARVELYRTRLAKSKPLLSGNDLKRLGLAPGPRYRAILARLHAAQLDGEIETDSQAENLARQMMTEED